MSRPATTATCEECGDKYYARNKCRKHYQKAFRHTFPSRANAIRKPGERRGRKRSESVEYRAAHQRLAKERGKAAEHQCADCPSQADEWSLSHNAEHVLISAAASSLDKPYSLNVNDYDPRCRSCHRKYDGITFTEGNRYRAC